MVFRKRKINTTKPSITKKSASKKTNEEEKEFKDLIPFSLPVLSDEKLLCEEYVNKIGKAAKVEKKVPRVVLSKIKITCEPLNVEKIIDFENPGILHGIKRTKKEPEKKKRKTVSVKSVCRKQPVNLPLTKLPSQPAQSKPLSIPKKRKREIKEKTDAKKAEVHTVEKLREKCEPVKKKKIKIFINGLEVTHQSKSFSHSSKYVQQKSKVQKKQNFQASRLENFKKQSCNNLNDETRNKKELPCFSSLCNLDDESAFLELKDVNLEELAPSLEEICDEELKAGENELDKYTKVDVVTDQTVLLNLENIIDKTDLNQVNGDLSDIKKNCMQDAVEAFMSSPQLNNFKEITALKKGLCSAWLSNNYKCSNENCQYIHNALNLFTRKLGYYSSKFIMTAVVSMRNDELFVDVVMAAFKILTKRQLPIVWVTFLIYFVFYVTEPSDSRFLKFWTNSARFFNQLNQNYAAANGFASLLSIFSQVGKGDQWKIIEFIKLIKQPPVQVPTNYALLIPVLKIELPPEFLFEAIESCINTQKDIFKVYSVIIPKISLMSSPVHVIELLLRFCLTLDEMNYTMYADNLRQRLQTKVLSIKSKITQGVYPLTALFQEEVHRNLNEGNLSAVSYNLSKQISNTDTEVKGVDSSNNYFQLEGDFWNSMAEVMKFSSDAVSNTHNNVNSLEKVVENTSNNEEDVCERQVIRIRQFFQDRQFDLLGKYFNELKANVVEQAAEEFLKLLFQMKISLRQVIDLVKIIFMPCKTENSAKVIASISITLILNLVRINEWNKAYKIVLLCQEKEINLVEGKVFYFNEGNIITQCRIVLLLIEIYSFKSEYGRALELVKKHSLFSSKHPLWKLIWKPEDEVIRLKILENLLHQIISKQLTALAFELFEMIWKEQNQLVKPLDLRKYLNEILILLLNQDSEDAVNLYEKTKSEKLNDITVRAILVTLVRRNRLSAAKNILLSLKQDTYIVPAISFSSFTVTISSFWLEEEIYMMFDTVFDLLAAEKQKFNSFDLSHLDINVLIKMPKKVRCSAIRPLCLGIIKPSFKDACFRIQRVLQYQFIPPLKLIVMPYSAKLEEHSVKVHLQKRVSRVSF